MLECDNNSRSVTKKTKNCINYFVFCYLDCLLSRQKKLFCFCELYYFCYCCKLHNLLFQYLQINLLTKLGLVSLHFNDLSILLLFLKFKK
mgnify:CR=1 FL=1